MSLLGVILSHLCDNEHNNNEQVEAKCSFLENMNSSTVRVLIAVLQPIRHNPLSTRQRAENLSVIEDHL